MKKTIFLFVVLFLITELSSLLGVSEFSNSIKSLKSSVSSNNILINSFDNKLLIARNTGSRSFSSRSTSTYKYRPTKVHTKPIYRNSDNSTAAYYSKNNNTDYKSNYDYYGNTAKEKSILNTKIANFSITNIMTLLVFVLFIYFVVKRVRKNRKFMKDYKAKIKNNKTSK